MVLKFPKPIKSVRNYRDYGYPKKKKRTILKEKSRSQLIKDLDKLFSKYIQDKAKNICFKCGRAGKGVSHYYSRRYIGTRWNTDNCDWACWACHFHHLEHFKQPGEWYHRNMILKLGTKGFKELEIKAHGITKFSNVDIKNLIANFDKIWL